MQFDYAYASAFTMCFVQFHEQGVWVTASTTSEALGTAGRSPRQILICTQGQIWS